MPTIFGYDLDGDVRAVEAMSNALVPYVYQDELYGMLPGNAPRLTVGGLLMRLHRLQQLTALLSPRQQQIVADSQHRLEAARKEWHVHYVGKLKREFKARVDAIEQFLNECTDNLRACAENYPAAMEKRVMIEQMVREAADLDELSDDMKTRIVPLDNAIRRYVESSDFRWDKRLEQVYSPDQYWYLYSTVITKK
jgi:hypothetical protein